MGSTFLGKESTFLGRETTFSGIKSTFLGMGIILINSTFTILEFFGRSLVRPRFVFGLLHGVDIQGTREGNLNKSTFE